MQTKRKQVQAVFKDGFVFLLGGSLYSAAVNCFTAGNHILNGGFTGLAVLLHDLCGAPIGTTVFLLNIPFFILAYRKLGRKFILRTAAATLLVSALVDAGAALPVYKNDLLLAALCGGVLSGAGLGLIFLQNATTGGTDILAKLVHRRFVHLSMGKIIFYFDTAVILLGGLFYRRVESMLYAAIVIFVSAVVVDSILYGRGGGSVLLVITEKPSLLQDLLTQKFHRGVTLFKGQGGYTGAVRQILFCACPEYQTHRLLQEICKADSTAFCIVTKAREIVGEGFSGEKP